MMPYLQSNATPTLIHARTNRTDPLLLFISDPYFASIAYATRVMIGRRSFLSYPVCVVPSLRYFSPSPSGVAVRSATRSSRAISLVASRTAFGTTFQRRQSALRRARAQAVRP